jgi:hypothetical protein
MAMTSEFLIVGAGFTPRLRVSLDPPIAEFKSLKLSARGANSSLFERLELLQHPAPDLCLTHLSV